MRTNMSQAELRERRQAQLSEMEKTGNELVDKWSNSKAILGEDVVGKSNGNASRLEEMWHKDKKKARNWATLLENTQKYTKTHLNETQIAQSVSGVTPNNVMKVISYFYPNSVRSEIFHEWAMQTTKDSYYFLTRQYAKTKRGATDGGSIISSLNGGRPASEIEVQTPDEVVDGAETTFTTTLAPAPLVRKKTLIFLGNVPVAFDDGDGTLIGISSDTADAEVASGTIDYTTGDTSIVFATAPTAGLEITIQFSYDSEVEANYDETMSVKLALQEVRFTPRPHNVNLEWSQMLTWEMGSTLDVDAEQQFILAAGDELKAGADRRALGLGYKYAKKFAPVVYDASFATAGANDPAGYASTFTRALKSVEKSMYGTLNKGGVNVAYTSADVVGFLEQSNKWRANEQAIKIGPYLAGWFNGIPVYQAEGTLGMANDEMVVIYKNQADPDDAFLSFGVYLPMVMTPKIQYKSFDNEIGVSSVSASEHINDYARIIKFDHLLA